MTNQNDADSSPFEECDSLDQVREHIDRLDHVIVPLLVERNHYVMQAAKLKGDVNAARVPARIEDVVQKVRGVAEARGSNPEIVEAIYRAMIEINIQLEQDQIEKRNSGG
ncbi:MAG: chorismate mutase [Rhodospirillaceae bacterium]|jgi:isochorismate pyruvate lyase|nr:chorismate mutase [Rhodospirillaceae bacterium]MBT5241014.1 chorismate mutase [Rhodospirillaceae bacterium]MBT5564630.1 chorismate mutase [Rhodospirillaceae bacterium]MBT6090965.1 chorismate mutase [Rhodospirillaceae bacterium]MBT6959568.1 chorismate mutase [Rhodospirillaceae bacterium]